MLVSGSPMVVMLIIFHLIELATSFPSYFVKPSIPLNDFIKHYEPALYDAKEVTNQHKRIRRAASANGKNNDPLKLTISTADKIFKLVLRPDEFLFSDDVVFEGDNGKIVNFDPGKAYIGTLEDDERTKVRGIITEEGLFDGTISTQFEEFYIEPISRYKPSSKSEGEGNGKDETHTIMYKISDVTQPKTPLCASLNFHAKRKPSDLNTIAYRSKRTIKERPPDANVNSFSSSGYTNELSQEDDRGGWNLWPSSTTTDDGDWPKLANLFERVHGSAEDEPFYQSYRHIPIFHHFPSTLETRSSASSVLDSYARSKFAHQPSTAQPKDSEHMYYDLDLAAIGNGVRKQLDESNDESFANETVHQFNSKHWRPKAGLIDTVYKYTNVTKSSKGYLPPSGGILHKSNAKILIGSGGGADEAKANLIITNDDALEQHARKRAIVDPKKTTCMLYLQADHLFFEKYGTEETCIEVMTRHVQRVNSIYRNTDFNQDGKPDNISFMIKRIKVHSTKDPSYRFPGNYGVEKFLEIFSEEDYDAFCLAYMFTYRDFEMGTLGLAWTGDLKNAGGVCEKNGHYRGSLKSLNTGIVTVLNYGKHVPSAVSHVTLAHEIGHNFGSPHDPEGCTPGGDDGNFIMFARATSGDKKNNNKFSPCSLNAINPVLNVKARSSKGCFTEPQTSICGNGVVEPDEECDCGWEEDCKDACCYPQRRYPPLDEPPCRLSPNAVCSPSQGPCCTNECKIKSGDMCRSDNGCRDSSYCNGVSPQCPPSINKPNKTVCNEEYVCYMGECTGSICLAYGLESCQCIPTPSDLPTKACELCCKLPGENQPCMSSFQWNQAPYDVPDMFAKPGTPCNDYNGYCDVFRKCREVDPSGPIATLRKLLLSEENIASFKKWAYDHWYYCGLIFFTFLLFMVISTKILSKKPKIKSVTVVHSSPTETVRLPTDGSGGPAVVVHPIVVRTKLPLKKKVRENKRRAGKSTQNQNGDTAAVGRNLNNNHSPTDTKKKKRASVVVVDAKEAKFKSKKTKSPAKNVKKDTKPTQPKLSPNSGEDPLGKVRNWLISSHNIDGLGSLKKSKSSPASFDLSEANGAKKRHKNAVVAAAAAPANVETNAGKNVAKKLKDTRVKLQVVYKPPFKFSVKLGKRKNEISSHLIKDKRPEAVKQRAALLIRADRIRANAEASAGIGNTVETTTKIEQDNCKAKDTVAVRPECKRSISAPQPQLQLPPPPPEPVYENTVFEAIVPRNSEKQTREEPQYVNICAAADERRDLERNRDVRPDNGDGGDRTADTKRTSASYTRNSASKAVNSDAVKTIVKRRNSCDARPVLQQSAHFKRQFSDECGTANASLRNASSNEFKRKPGSVKRSSSGDVKPTNASRSHMRKSNSTRKGSRDHVTSHSSDKTKKPPDVFCGAKLSGKIDHDSAATRNAAEMAAAAAAAAAAALPSVLHKTNDKSTFIKRTASNGNARKIEGDKFKRYSLQSADTLLPAQSTNAPRKSVAGSVFVTQESAEIPFRQLQVQYDVPSDLEVLLSETENPTES